jgi:TctA family transporter
MLMSKGSLGVFFANGLVTSLVVAAMALLLLPLVLWIARTLQRPGQPQASREKGRII